MEAAVTHLPARIAVGENSCSRIPAEENACVEATKRGLCEPWLKPAHEDDCDVQCAKCRRPHNVLLCADRQSVAPSFKRRRP
ncbi:hypothetical protein Aduo_015480 [Ancylostoma duodenale]